jgi:hypothetical protein
MHRQSFNELRSHLLESGIAPSHVRRITAELSDHLEDLKLEALENGLSAQESELHAVNRLGDQKIIAQRILAHAEFRTWIYRYPRIARIYLPVAYALVLPAAPIFAGMANPSIVVRWGAALMLSGAVTAGMFLIMQLSIVLT